MDGLIGRLVADAGVDRNAAETAVASFSTSWPRKDLPNKRVAFGRAAWSRSSTLKS